MLIYIATMNFISRILSYQKRCEGDFRWCHARVVGSCEPICLYAGEQQEQSRADEDFASVYWVYRGLCNYVGILYGWTIFFQFFGAPLRFTFIYLAGIRSGKVFVVSGYLTNGFNACTLVPSIFSQIAAAAGPCHRTAMLLEAVQRDPSSYDTILSRFEPRADGVTPFLCLFPVFS